MDLILNARQLRRFEHGGRGRPGVAVTFAMADGEIRLADAVMTGLGCRVRYEIDMSDRRDEVLWKLPSKDERMFNVRIGVGWRVFDPCEITRRQVRDGFHVLQAHLHPVVRRHSRVLEIERLHDLEDQINALVAIGPARFAEGLEVFHLDAQVGSDDQTTSHAESLRAQDRNLDIQSLQHIASLNAARSQIDLDTLRRRAIEDMVSGKNGLLLHHLTVHRDDTMGVMKALQQQDQTSRQALAQLFQQFKDQLLPEELNGLAEHLLQQMRGSLDQSGMPALVQPHVPPAVIAGTALSPPALPAAAPDNPAPEPLRTTPTTNGAGSEPPPAKPAATGGGGANVAEWQPVRTDNGEHG